MNRHDPHFGTVFALMFLATVPVLVFHLAPQRHFVKGLTARGRAVLTQRLVDVVLSSG